jgi:hypothetical protein
MEKLRDIRDLEVIPDVSFYFFVALVIFSLALLVGIGYMVYKHFSSKSKDLTKKEVLKRLKDIEFDDPKTSAYKITKYARFLADDEKSLKVFNKLESKLLKYKYIPSPPAIDQDTINHYNLFLKSVDE